jgi:hypothetical protein
MTAGYVMKSKQRRRKECMLMKRKAYLIIFTINFDQDIRVRQQDPIEPLQHYNYIETMLDRSQRFSSHDLCIKFNQR